jgi:ABC-2 type transport system permease protein
MISIYLGLAIVLKKLSTDTAVAYLHPSMILDILLFFLYALLFFSNAVSAIGALFMSADFTIFRAAPLTKATIFSGKLLETLASSTWMVVVFGIPGLVAFSTAYSAGFPFILISILILIPYLIIPAALSMAVVTVLARIIPVSRTKEIFAICGIILLIGFYFILDVIFATANKPLQGVEDILYLVEAIRAPNAPWLPSHWVATILGNILAPSPLSSMPYLTALIGTTLAIISLSYLIFVYLHDKAYSHAQSAKNHASSGGLVSLTEYPPFSWIFNQQERALLSKEVSTFLRDFTQSIQLMLILGLCAFYLYNLRILRVVENLPLDSAVWWQSFLIIGNLGMGTFIIAAIATRFVFPSVSLEGKSYWILKSSPVALKSVLKAKFKVWYFPISLVGSVLLLSGAMAIQAEPKILILTATISWLTCISIVGLAVGFGSYYANFEWEHSSQLAASFGSLIYMLSCIIVIIINMIPLALLLVTNYSGLLGKNDSQTGWYISLFLVYFLLYHVNRSLARWSIKIGQRSLEQRES